MKSEIDFSDTFLDEVKKLRKAGEKIVLKKIDSLLDELQEHPYSGTGKPKLLVMAVLAMVAAYHGQTPPGVLCGR